VNLSIDKPRIFENEESESIDMDNAKFEIDPQGNLLVRNQSTLDLIGYFPKDKWDCVYMRTDDE
jgi:hypothetical protein